MALLVKGAVTIESVSIACRVTTNIGRHARLDLSVPVRRPHALVCSECERAGSIESLRSTGGIDTVTQWKLHAGGSGVPTASTMPG